MTKKTIPISDILGDQYYKYDIWETQSRYKVDINTTVSIDCKVTDTFGNVVTNENIQLMHEYHDPISYPSRREVDGSSQTTNNQGIASFSVQLTQPGFHIFIPKASTSSSVAESKIIFYVDDHSTTWQTVSLTNMSGCTLYYNDDFCALKIEKSGVSVGTVNTYENIVSGTIPSTYRPAVPIVMRNDGTMNIYLKVTDEGVVQMLSDYKPSTSFTVRTIITWARV